MFFIIYFRTKYLIKHLLTWIYFGLRWVVVDIFWLQVGGGGWWWIYFSCRCMVVGDIFWLVVGGGEYIIAGGGWWWVVVDGGGWWHSLV